jgi:hypothetical protein
MEKLTKRQAIKRSIELWAWLAETGKNKNAWLGWKNYGNIKCNCFLCEYSWNSAKKKGCSYSCPLKLKTGIACIDGVLDKWIWEKDIEKKKGYARELLEQLKSCLPRARTKGINERN